MLRLSYKYQDEERLKAYLQGYSVYERQECLVRIVTSSMDKATAVHTAKVIKEILPKSKILGVTSGGAVIFCGEQIENGTFITIEVFDQLKIKAATFFWDDKSPAELADQVFDVFGSGEKNHDKMVHLMFSEGYIKATEFLEEINAKTPIIKMVGGVASPSGGVLGFVFDENGAHSNALMAFSIEGSSGQYFVKSSTSHEEISTLYTVTGVQGDTVTEINNLPAKRWIYDYFDIEKDENMSIEQWSKIATDDYMPHFPLILDGGTSARFGKIDPDAEGITFYSAKLKEGEKFRMGYVNPAKVIQQTSDLCESILDTPVEQMFVYSCLFRKTYLKNSSKWELLPFKKHGICGMYNMGEIGNKDGKNLFYHGSSVFTGVAEREHYLLPSVSELENIDDIRDDKSFVEKAAEKQRQALRRQNAHRLLDKLQAYEADYNETHWIDKEFGIPNLHRYEADNQTEKFDKLCMVEVQSADTTIAFSGQDAYYESVRDVLSGTAKVIEGFGLGVSLPIYALNYKTLLVPAGQNVSEEMFIEYCKKMSEAYSSVTSSTGISGVARFVVVLNQDDMVEIGLNALLAHKSSPDNLIVCDKDTNVMAAMEEIKALELVKTAIAKKQIVPHYQGIYNNATGKIDKYEALMRIVDEQGKVYSPFVFLGVAQTYKFYNKLSQLMIERSLNEFSGRIEALSINVSLFDIVSSSFRTWMVRRLEKYPHPQNIIVEFTETHDLKNLDVIFEFVSKIRALGVKVAVDDFGSGYSTFATIVALKPDYIKIDGSIISGLVGNENNRVILDTIVYLARRMGTQTVAEFVETGEIQKIITESGGDFSQGYHFSKPRPIERLL